MGVHGNINTNHTQSISGRMVDRIMDKFVVLLVLASHVAEASPLDKASLLNGQMVGCEMYQGQEYPPELRRSLTEIAFSNITSPDERRASYKMIDEGFNEIRNGGSCDDIEEKAWFFASSHGRG